MTDIDALIAAMTIEEKAGQLNMLAWGAPLTGAIAAGDATGAVRDGKVGSLIDQLIGDGFLFRDLNHEYKLISITSRGASADLAALRAAGHPDADSAAPRRSFRR